MGATLLKAFHLAAYPGLREDGISNITSVFDVSKSNMITLNIARNVLFGNILNTLLSLPVNTHILTHAYIIYIHTHIHTPRYIHTHTHTHTQIHEHTHSHTYSHTHSHSHTHRDTYTHTHSHTHILTHTQSR